MSDNLQLKVTHAIQYIHELEKYVNKALDLTKKTFSKLESLDDDDQLYNEKVRKTVIDYKDDMDDIYELQERESKLFSDELDYIDEHINDEIVIYSLKHFIKKEDDLKKLKEKEVERLMDKIQVGKKEAKRYDDLVLTVGYGQLLFKMEHVHALVDEVHKKIKKLVKKDKEENK